MRNRSPPPSILVFSISRFLDHAEKNKKSSSNKRLTFKSLPDLTDLCSSKLDAASCLVYLRKNKVVYHEEVFREQSMKKLMHVFWKGTITRHALLCVKSFLYTQHLYCTRLVLWRVDEEMLLQRAVNNTSSTASDGAARSLQRLDITF